MPVVIVEGPDNAGKSTLIAHLAATLGLSYVPGEGPAKSTEEINERVMRYAQKDNVIFDRHPCISQPLYNQFRTGGPEIERSFIDDLYRRDDVLFVYCRGRPGVEGHVIKAHDSQTDAMGTRHEDTVRDNYLAICRAYDEWALKWAHVSYRVGDGYGRVRRMVASWMSETYFDPISDIREFHEKFGLEYNGPPRALAPDLLEFRQGFMQEELNEYVLYSTAATDITTVNPQFVDQADYAYNLEHAFDGLIDKVYVDLGTNYLHGFNFVEGWRRVHKANMSKIRATNVDQSARSSTHDVVKPKEWKAPRLIDLVERNDLSLKSSKS